MSIHRPVVHVAGPAGSGKTAFLERLLESNRSRLLAVARCEACPGRKRSTESFAERDPELARYREAGASSAVRYRYPAEWNAHDDFYCTEFMADYSEGILVEGDSPLVFAEATVHVTRPLPRGSSLVVRAPLGAARAQVGPAEGEIGATVEALLAGAPLTGEMLELLKALGGPAPPRWALAEGYAGLALAQVVVLNVRDEGERARAETMLPEIARLRKDEGVFQDVIGWRGNRTPITVGVADLSDRRDPGLKRLLTRVKRAFRARS